jgi:hypothetical protein
MEIDEILEFNSILSFFLWLGYQELEDFMSDGIATVYEN